MDTNITNIAQASGTFNSLPTSFTSEPVVTPMTTDLTIVKTANQAVWVTDNLIYTVTLTNSNTLLPLEGVTFTDVIDPTLATLVADSVTVNDVTTAYTFDNTTGTLTVPLADVAANSSVVIKFAIRKV